MRKIGLLVSITLHVCLIYWFFTTPIPSGNLQIKEKVITVIPIAPGSIVLYDTTLTRKIKNKTSFKTSGTPSVPTTPGTETTTRTDLGKERVFPEFSLGPSTAQSPSPLLQYKSDFLLGENKEKQLPHPFGKLPTEQEIDFRQYLSSSAHPYGHPSLGMDLPGGSGRNNTSKEDESYKQKTGRIDFDVSGLDLKPWVKQVINKIQLNWQISPGLLGYANASLTVGIKITIEKSGSLSNAEIGQSSLVEAIDHAALAALKMSAPFPGLPAEFPEKNLVAYLRFNVNNND